MLNFTREITQFGHELNNNLPLQARARAGQVVILADVKPHGDFPHLTLRYFGSTLFLTTDQGSGWRMFVEGKQPIIERLGADSDWFPARIDELPPEARARTESYWLTTILVAEGIRADKGVFGIYNGNLSENYCLLEQNALTAGREYLMKRGISLAREERVFLKRELVREGSNLSIFPGLEKRG